MICCRVDTRINAFLLIANPGESVFYGVTRKLLLNQGQERIYKLTNIFEETLFIVAKWILMIIIMTNVIEYNMFANRIFASLYNRYVQL